MNVSSAIIIGRMCKDVEIKYGSNGMAFGNFSVAVNDKKKDKESEVSFFDLKAFGKTAEALHDYAKKGNEMLFFCKPKQERWQGQDGKQNSKIVFYVERFEFGAKRQDGESGQGSYQKPQYAPEPQYAPQPQEFEEEIPF